MKKWIAMLLMLTMLVSMFAGCTPAATTPAAEDTAAPEEPTYASTLTLPTGTPLPQFGDAWTALKTSL